MKIDKIGKFQVVATLGTGAHSSVLQIRRQADSRNYVLKVVPVGGPEDQKFLDQARHEYEIAQLLDHPNLIKVYALEMERDWLFRVRKAQLLIEYVNGKPLDTLPRLAIPKLVQVFAQVAAALAHMHRRRVFHADLKPRNVMLSRAGGVKVIDYGLAWRKGENKGRVQGTPEYMAPEQARSRAVNERTDVYNFGATMYRLVTWRYPPNPLSPGAAAANAGNWDKLYKPVGACTADAPAPLADLIHRCLAFQPEERPDRVTDVQSALDAMVEELVRRPEDRLEALEF